MKHLIAVTALTIALTPFPEPVLAQAAGLTAQVAANAGLPGMIAPEAAFDRRSRKRGGRDKLRIPGGSGCDDPGDILEHPECAG